MFSILFLWFSYYRLPSISLILEAHQQLRWYLVQTKDVVLDFKPQILFVLLKIISVVTLSSMVMEVAHQDIMYRICCISTPFLVGLWWIIFQLLLYSGEILWICQVKIVVVWSFFRTLEFIWMVGYETDVAH